MMELNTKPSTSISFVTLNTSINTEESNKFEYTIISKPLENVIDQTDCMDVGVNDGENTVPPLRVKRKAIMDEKTEHKEEVQDKRSKQDFQNPISDAQFNVETSNQFSELDNTTNPHVDDEFPPLQMSQRRERKVTSKKPNNINTNKSKTDNTNHTNTPQSKPMNKLPPIIVFNVENKSLIEALSVVLEKNVFRVQIINANRSHILTSNMMDYKKVLEFLKHRNANSFSYPPKESKPSNYVVKGIDRSYDNEDVKLAILEQ